MNKLFEIMQEYCISDKGKRRRIEEMNVKRSRNRDRPKPHQAEQAKNPKAVNTVSGDEARDSRPQDNRGGRSDRSNSNRGRRENSGQRQKVPYCCIDGRDKGHWTSDCPLVKEKKEEFDRRTNTQQSPKPVNYNHTNQPRGPPPTNLVAAFAATSLDFGIPHFIPILPNFPLQPHIHPTSPSSPFGTSTPTNPKPFGATSSVAPTTPTTSSRLPSPTSKARTRHSPRKCQ
jgi:hypothetical protein